MKAFGASRGGNFTSCFARWNAAWGKNMSASLLHVAAQLESPGGMGAILRRHRKCEPASAFIGLFDRPRGRGQGATWHLGARAWTSPAGLRAAFARAAAEMPPVEVAVYHNAWGAAWFAGMDRVQRRVALLHTDLPDFEAFVSALHGQFDGVICLSEAMRDVCVARLPELGAARCFVVRCPVEPPPVAPALHRPATQPLRLGYAGRLERKQKRLDRVAPFLAQLDALGVAWQFEFLGDGPMRAALARQFRAEPRVTFLGWRNGVDYWQALAAWDALVFFSDYEASPVALHEAMSVGVIPFFPRLGRTQGEVEAAQVDPAGVYPPGDVARAAAQVRQFFAQSAAGVTRGRETAAAVARTHLAPEYDRAISAAVAQVAAAPRVSVNHRRAARGSDHVPIGLLDRLSPHVLRV